MMEELKNEDWRPLALPAAIIVAALLISGAMLYSANTISTNIYTLKAALATANPTGGGGTGGLAAATATPTAPPAGNQGPGYDISNRPFRGTANAPVTIVEYSDFQCSFCSRAEATITQLLNDYPGKLKVVYLNYPLPFHENAQKAAEAFECAVDQGKAYEMHDKMFDNQGALEVSNLKQYAADLGLDTQRFNSCLDSGSKTAIVEAQTQAGSDAGVEGTPTFFINGRVLVGAQPIDKFKTIIDAELAR